jgi:hypothetical protein
VQGVGGGEAKLMMRIEWTKGGMHMGTEVATNVQDSAQMSCIPLRLPCFLSNQGIRHIHVQQPSRSECVIHSHDGNDRRHAILLSESFEPLASLLSMTGVLTATAAQSKRSTRCSSHLLRTQTNPVRYWRSSRGVWVHQLLRQSTQPLP